MSILLIDDEENTRAVVREMLEALGYREVLEASDGQQALELILRETSAITFIISDNHMPGMDGLQLVKKVGQEPNLNHTHFLLMTSDFSSQDLGLLYKTHSRIDHCLSKPFTTEALEEALILTSKRWTEKRQMVLYFGEQDPKDMKDYLTSHPKVHWREVKWAKSARELDQLFKQYQEQVGALILHPSESLKAPVNWLKHLRMEPLGMKIMVLCLAIEPEVKSDVGTFSDFAIQRSFGWEKILSKIGNHAKNRWLTSQAINQAKNEIQRHNNKLAVKILKNVLKMDPLHLHASELLGIAYRNLDQSLDAIKYWQAALQYNPFSSTLLNLCDELSEVQAKTAA